MKNTCKVTSLYFFWNEMLNIACVTDEMLQSLKPINIFGYSSYQTITVPNPNITVPNRANSSGTGTTLTPSPPHEAVGSNTSGTGA